MDADVVLGQPDFTKGTANNGGISAHTLNFPITTFSKDGKKLFVSDAVNRRVLIWNSIPTTNFTPADVVLGQPDFVSRTANNGGISARSLNTINRIGSDGRRLFVVDQVNNRVLIWSSIPTTNFAPADVVLGQPDFVSSTANNGGISARTLNSPVGIFSDGRRLFVADTSNNRILIWNTIPTTNFASADLVLGQPDFSSSTANNGGISARSLSSPREMFSDGRKLFITDGGNSRILIWNQIPTANFTPADVVLGKSDFTKGDFANDGGLSASSLLLPTGIFSDGNRLFVVDNFNNRILIWNTIPTTNFAPADVVLGQPDFVSNTASNGGRSAHTLNRPETVFSDGKRLFVGGNSDHRVLIFNLFSGATPKLGPQFDQGKAVLGKVFWDLNGNGSQDKGENGVDGIKVVSDTGIYAITDEDGKYHFPYIETGQRILKIDLSSLPEGSVLTTESPRKVIVTPGILTKASFGVRPLEDRGQKTEDGKSASLSSVIRPPSSETPLLKVSISEDPLLLKPSLSIEAKQDKDKILFTIHTNYALFIQRTVLSLYDEDLKPIQEIELPSPIPLDYALDKSKVLDPSARQKAGGPQDDKKFLHYQLKVYDSHGHEDRTGVGRLDEVSS